MAVMGLQPFQTNALAQNPAFRSLARPAAPIAQAPANSGPVSFAGPAPAQPGYLTNVIQRQVRSQGIRTAENARRRAAILQHLQGLDPNQARVAQLNSDAGISSGESDALNNGALSGALSDQSYARQLADERRQRDWMLADRAHEEARQRFNIGGALGSLVGIGAGSYLGGLGARLGAGGGGGTPALSYPHRG